VWGPRLVAVYGVGLVGAGVFVADPMNGFPPGTPDGPPAVVTVGGIGHLVVGGIGFLALVVACFVLARAYRARPAMAWSSRVAGVVFLLGFLGIASGSASPAVVLGFWVGLLVVWAWLAAVSLDLYRRTPLLTPASPHD
jgi:heme A synthase